MPRVLSLALLLLLPVPVAAQYFGQNKVQYRQFDFAVMRTDHFDIYHYPEERAAVDRVAPIAELWRARLGMVLDHELRNRQPLVMYASAPHFQQTTVIPGAIGEGTGGVTDFLKRRITMPFATSLGETSHVVGHELVHAFQQDLGGPRAAMLPLWFVEGMAEYLSLGGEDAQTSMWLRGAFLEDKLPSFTDLDSPRLFPYRFGHAAWAYLAGRYGDKVVGQIYVEASRTGDPIGAIETMTGEPIKALSDAWHAAIREQYGALRKTAAPPGQVLIPAPESGAGALNVSPALSPDGKWLVFLSERDLFSIDLYLAEASTGRVVRRLTKTATNPHFDSLQFIASAGAWDAASRRFAFTAIAEGKATLNILELPEGSTRELTLESVDEAMHPSWSPDGRSIVFTGLAGGFTDLFVIEPENARVRRITNDGFADFEPAWSPSGRELVFVTDRFSTDLRTLRFGNYRLARMRLEGNTIEALPAFDRGKHINPQWSADGDTVYFIAEPDGVPNVYRLDVGTGRIASVTDVATGIAGITPLSPAISYAPAANRLAYGHFENGRYSVYTLEGSALADTRPASGGNDARAVEVARLPGQPRGGDLVARAMALEPAPLDPRTLPVDDYKPKLALDFAGASTGVGVSTGAYGSFVGGGIGFSFSDVLGYHTLATVIQASGGTRDIGGQVLYLNSKSRWNWGASALVLPYVSGSFSEQLATVNGQPVLVSEQLLFRQTDAQVVGLAQYPFSRAFRFEMQGGAHQIWFGQELETQIVAPTGELLARDVQKLDAPSALTLGMASAALVYDTSIFGPTSPIAGQRWRVDAGPTIGTLRFTTLTLDYRRYQSLARPFTLAVRGLHIGRFGADAEDERLAPFFLGYPTLVRGYEVGSFGSADCIGDGTSSCPAFDNLIGSRLMVGNAELRFPLIGAFTREYRYGPVPIEGFVFGDAGVAWTSQADPVFAGGNRELVRSAGAGVRVNAFGYAVLELAAIRPLDRPRKGWTFGFNLTPGF